MRPYPWLVDYLNARLPELEGLRDTPKGLEKARSWFKALLKYFRRRQLKTPRQQKNYVVDVRNAIRSRFGEDHPALKVVGFDEDTWTQINKPIHDRVEDRNQNTRFLKDPDAIVQRAETLLSSKTSTWADLAVGARRSYRTPNQRTTRVPNEARTKDELLGPIYRATQESRRPLYL